MSAFIVSEGCMKNIIYNLYWDYKFKDRADFLLREHGINCHSVDDFNNLYINLYKLNQEAVKQRYNEPDNSNYITIPDKPDWDQGTVNKYQALKSIQCLLYQCSEGTVPETKLYKFLEAFEKRYMHYIIDDIPEYDKARWD